MARKPAIIVGVLAFAGFLCALSAQGTNAVATRDQEMLAMEKARRAVTVLGNKNDILPLSPLDTKKIADLEISDTEDPKGGRSFHSMLHDRRSNIDFAKVDQNSNNVEYESALETAKAADLIICQVKLFTRSGEMTGLISRKQREFLTRAFTLGKPVILISFGNPYIVMDLPKVDAYVCAYSDA
ncbi:hypothetical protein D4R75_11660 [bacterium]|nr:MAG: hypothetical protein D4R75_11660 [bacterium]